MKKTKRKKQDKQNAVLEIKKKDVYIWHAVMFAGFAAIIAGLLIPARLASLSGWLIAGGIISAIISTFARDYLFRCPCCGEILMKKQPVKNKIKGITPKGCPKCGWHCTVIIVAEESNRAGTKLSRGD